MRRGQMAIVLEPEQGGTYTRVQLCGIVPAVPKKAVARLVRQLAFWSGWPVSCVIVSDLATAGWCEWWTDLLADIPLRYLEIRYPLQWPEDERVDP